jgi:hypothetical protein
VGHSSVKAEVAELEKYLAMPNVHLELTLNFDENGERPGSKIDILPQLILMMLLLFWLK